MWAGAARWVLVAAGRAAQDARLIKQPRTAQGYARPTSPTLPHSPPPLVAQIAQAAFRGVKQPSSTHID